MQRADYTRVDHQHSGKQEEPFHSSLAAELGASYVARYFIAVPALGHPVHLPFPSADIPHAWCAIPVPRSSLASESIPMMLHQHIQNVESGQTMPTVREIGHQQPSYTTHVSVSICLVPPSNHAHGIQLHGSVAVCQTLKGTGAHRDDPCSDW